MSKITRHHETAIYSKIVDYHGFVYLAGLVANDLSKDIKGQTQEVLDQIDALLEEAGTDKTRLLEAQIWLKDIADRDGMNEVWSQWVSPDNKPVRACVQSALATPKMLVEIKVTACK